MFVSIFAKLISYFGISQAHKFKGAYFAISMIFLAILDAKVVFAMLRYCKKQ
jgi:hypothetical protein